MNGCEMGLTRNGVLNRKQNKTLYWFEELLCSDGAKTKHRIPNKELQI